MGIKEIENDIIATGNKEIKLIEKETKATLEDINKKINEERNLAYKEAKNMKRKEYEIILKKIVSDARVKKNKRICETKTEILESVFSKAKEKILKLPDDEKKRVLEKLINSSSKEIGDAAKITVDKKYAALLKERKNVFSDNIGDFGIIVESRNGLLRIDNTLTNTMERMRTKLEPIIVKTLF